MRIAKIMLIIAILSILFMMGANGILPSNTYTTTLPMVASIILIVMSSIMMLGVIIFALGTEIFTFDEVVESGKLIRAHFNHINEIKVLPLWELSDDQFYITITKRDAVRQTGVKGTPLRKQSDRPGKNDGDHKKVYPASALIEAQSNKPILKATGAPNYDMKDVKLSPAELELKAKNEKEAQLLYEKQQKEAREKAELEVKLAIEKAEAEQRAALQAQEDARIKSAAKAQAEAIARAEAQAQEEALAKEKASKENLLSIAKSFDQLEAQTHQQINAREPTTKEIARRQSKLDSAQKLFSSPEKSDFNLQAAEGDNTPSQNLVIPQFDSPNSTDEGAPPKPPSPFNFDGNTQQDSLNPFTSPPAPNN